jgi:hypothetical protein
MRTWLDRAASCSMSSQPTPRLGAASARAVGWLPLLGCRLGCSAYPALRCWGPLGSGIRTWTNIYGQAGGFIGFANTEPGQVRLRPNRAFNLSLFCPPFGLQLIDDAAVAVTATLSIVRHRCMTISARAMPHFCEACKRMFARPIRLHHSPKPAPRSTHHTYFPSLCNPLQRAVWYVVLHGQKFSPNAPATHALWLLFPLAKALLGNPGFGILVAKQTIPVSFPMYHVL